MGLLIPILRYRDPKAAVDWLAAAFGFENHFIAKEGEQIVHAQLRLGDDLIMLGPDHDEDRYGMHSPLSLNGTNQCIYIVSAEVDALYSRAKNAGARIVTEPYDTPYGSREFNCRDLEGHIWSIGSYRGESIPA